MSREIDERIVQMKFDNTMFERNVATSIGTLEKLKAALDFSGATNSLNNIERNVNAADFSKLANSVEAIAGRFSNWGIVGMTVIQDITRGVENLAMKILNIPISKFEQAFGLMKTGGWTRATNIDKAKFAIEGLGYAWDDLKDSIDGAVTDTRFGFDEAATAASQLVASNVAIGTEMDNALKSIANVASQTGDEYSSIAHIYTTIAGNGKLMTEQLNMFSYRGLNAAALIAKSMGKTEQEIREMTTKGEISFKQFSDAMNDALGEGAKRANDTFEGSLANMQAALKRMGQPFAEVIRKQMPPVFNDLKEFIKQIKAITDPLAEVFDTIFTNATRAFRYFVKSIDLTPLKNAVDTFGEFVKGVDAFLTKSSKVWGHLDKDLNGIVTPIKEATQYYTSFAESLLDKAKDITGIPTSALDAMRKVAKEAEDQYESFANSVLAKKDSLLGVPTSVFDQMKKLAGTTGKYIDEMILGDREGVKKRLLDGPLNGYEDLPGTVRSEEGLNDVISYIMNLTELEQSAEDITLKLKDAFHITFDDAKQSVEIVQGALKPTGNLIEQTTKAVEKTATSIEHVDEVAKKVLRGEYGNGQERIDKLEEEGENWKLIQNRVNELTGCAKRYEVEEAAVTTTVTKGNRKIAKVLEKRKTAMDAIGDMINSLSEKFKQLMDTVDKNGVAQKIGIIFNGIRDGAYLAIRIFSIFLNAALKPTFTFLQTVADAVLTTWATISEFVSEFRFITETTDMLIELEGTLNFVFWQISNVGKAIVGLFTDIANVVGSALIKVNGFKFLYSIVDLIGSLSEKAIEIIDDIRINMDRDAITDKIAAFLNGVIDGLTMIVRLASVVLNAAIKPFAALLTTIGSTLLNCVASVGKWITSLKDAATESGFFEKLEVILNNIFWIISDVGQVIANLFGGAFTKAVGSINNVVTRLKATFEAFKGTDAFKGLKKSLADLRYDFNQLKIKGTELIKKIFKGFGKTNVKLPTGPFELLLNIMTRASEAVSKFISFVVDKFDVEAFLKGVAKTVTKIIPVLKSLGTVVKNMLTVAFKGAISVFKSFFEIVSNLWDKVKSLWSEFKDSKGFEGIKGVASVIGGWFGDLFESIKNGDFKLPEIDVENLLPSLENIKAWAGERWEGFKSWLGEKWEALKAWFKEKWENLFKKEEGEVEKESAFELPGINFDTIKQSFDDFIGWVQEKLDALRKAVIKFLGGEVVPDEVAEGSMGLPTADDFMLIDSLDDYTKPHPVIEFLKNLASALLGLAGDTILTGLDVLDRLVKLIEEHFPTVGNILSTIVGDVLGEVEKFVEDINGTEELSDKVDKIKDIVVKIFGIVLKFKALKAVIGIADFFASLGDLAKAAKDAVKNFSRVLKGIGKAFTGAGRALTAFAILELAGAVLAMAGAFKILGSLTWDQFKVAAAAIGIITGALTILFLTLGGGKKEVVETPVSQIADAFKALGTKLSQGLKKLGTAAEIFAFVWGVKTIIDTIRGLTDFNWGDAHQGVELFTLVVGEVVGAIKTINLGNGKKTFGNQIGVAAELIALAIAVKSVAKTLIKLSTIDQSKLEAGVDAIDSVMWIAMKLSLLGGFDSTSSSEGSGKRSLWKKNKMNDLSENSHSKSSSTRNTKWKTILATAALVWVVGNALYKLAKLKDTGRLIAATDAITDVMTMCVAVLAAAGFISDESENDKGSNEWSKEGGLAGKIFGTRGAKGSHKNSYSKTSKAVKNILAIIGLIIVVSAAIALVANSDKAYKIETAANAIAKVVEMCALLLMASAFITDGDASVLNKRNGGLLSKLFGNKKVKTSSTTSNNAGVKILAICALIGTIAYSLYSLSGMDASKIEAAGDAIAKIALVCVGLLAAASFIENGEMSSNRNGGLMSKIFGETKSKKSSTTKAINIFQSVAPVVAAVVSAAGAIYGLRDVDPEVIDAAGNAIAKIALACAAIIGACSLVTSASGDGSWANQIIPALTSIFTVFESIEVGKNAIIALATLDVDAEKLKSSGEALFDALAGIAVVLLASGALTALGSGGLVGLITAGITALISIISAFIDQDWLYGTEGDPEKGIEATEGMIEKIIRGFNSIGRMINGFVSGLLGTDNVGEDIREGVGSVAEGFSTGFANLGDNITGAFESLQNLNIPQLMDSMGINEIPGKLSNFAIDFKTFTEHAKEIDSEDMNALKTALSALIQIIGVDAIIALVDTLKGDNESGIINAIKELNTNFFPNFNVFIAKAKGLDSTALSALESIVNVLEKVAKTTLLGDLAWLVGEAGLTKMAEALPALVEAMDKYNEAVKDKQWAYGQFVLTANCAMAVVKVANAAPKTGGVLQKILGEGDMQEFGKSVLYFIHYMIAANDKLKDVSFNQSAFDAAVAAGSAINDLAWKIPRTNGVVQWWLGESDLALFGTKLLSYIQSLIDAAEALGDGSVINQDAIDKAEKAGELMAKLEGMIPGQDGLLQEFVGEQNLGRFGRRLKAYVKHLVATSKLLTDNQINDTAITSAANVGKLLAELETSVAPTKGVLSDFFGDSQSIADFGERLKQFGDSMIYFSDMILGQGEWSNGHPFNNTAVTTAVETLQKLWDFVARVEGSGIGSIVNATDTNIEKAGVIEALQSFSTAVFDVVQFYNDLGAEILSDDAFDSSGILDNCAQAGEKIAKALVNGFKDTLSLADKKTGETSIMTAVSDAFEKAFNGDKEFDKDIKVYGVMVCQHFIEGLKACLTSDANETTFPSFAKEVIKVFEDMVYIILTVFTNATPTFRTRAEGWMKKLQEGISAYKESIIGSLKNIPIATLAFYGTQNSLFRSAGWNWMMELWDGINSGSSYVYELANSVASNVSDIIGGAVTKASSVPSGLSLMTDDFYTLGSRTSPMLNAMNNVASTGLRTATALEGAMNTASSNGEMAFQQLQSVAGIQNGAFSLSRDAGAIADTAAASMSRTASLARSASISSPVMSQVYVKDSNDTLEALNGMRRDIKALTDNMANMQMVLDSGVLVGQLTPGLDVSLSQRTRFKGRWA